MKKRKNLRFNKFSCHESKQMGWDLRRPKPTTIAQMHLYSPICMDSFQSEMGRSNRRRVGVFFSFSLFFCFVFCSVPLAFAARRNQRDHRSAIRPSASVSTRLAVSLSVCCSSSRLTSLLVACSLIQTTAHHANRSARPARAAAQPQQRQTKCRRSAAPTATDSDMSSAAQRSALALIHSARHCTPQLVSLLHSATVPLPPPAALPPLRTPSSRRAIWTRRRAMTTLPLSRARQQRAAAVRQRQQPSRRTRRAISGARRNRGEEEAR